MEKTRLSVFMIAFTAIWIACAVASPGEDRISARVVVVQRGDVHQVAAISGCLAYMDEGYICAAGSGVVSRIYAEAGQRVAEGAALLRMEAGKLEQALSAYAANAPALIVQADENWMTTTIQETALRADCTCVIRQVLVQENMPVAAGTPVFRTTSNMQHILCNAVDADAKRISPGMWARIYAEGESLGIAEVSDIGAAQTDALTGRLYKEVTLIPQSHVDLPEGTAIDVDVFLAGSDDVMTLPLEAITARGTVWWVHEGRCTEIPAEIVMTDEILAWVRLPEGIRIAVGEFEEGQLIREAVQ